MAHCNAELAKAEQYLQNIIKRQDEFVEPEEDEISMAELALRREYVCALQDSLVRQRLLVVEASEAVAEAREAFVASAVEAETLETLKKKRLQAFSEEQKKLEKKQMDTLTVTRHRFRKSHGGEHGSSD